MKTRKPREFQDKPQTVRAVGSNAGVAAMYRRRLLKELAAMQKSVAYWLEAAYKARETEIVGDASPVNSILKRFRADMRRWLKRWDWLAGWLGARVVEKASKTTTASMKEAFKAAGFAVNFQPSRNLNTVTQALIKGNVSLIKSIPRQYLTDVEGIVTRGVSMGRDLGYVTKELKKRYAITKRRAAFIARDQVDKATQAVQRTTDEQLGITEGIWIHLPGQYTSRKTHEAMNGKRFSLKEGLYDSAVGFKVLPGELPNCRCNYRPVLPDFKNLKRI